MLAAVGAAATVSAPCVLAHARPHSLCRRRPSCRDDPAADALAALAAQSLLLIEHSQLQGAMAACGCLLRDGASGGGRGRAAAGAALRRQLRAALRHSDDCLRKPELAAWLLRGGA